MASEQRLIAENDVYALFGRTGKAELHVADIDLLPRADAVEVVHGRWKEIGAADYQCSRCGFRFTSADPIAMFQYCRCGAKMDRERKDNARKAD